MDKKKLATVIRERARVLTYQPDGHPLTRGELADDGELLRVLARILDGKEVDAAFGSPGDWGYSHPIGKCIAMPEN